MALAGGMKTTAGYHNKPDVNQNNTHPVYSHSGWWSPESVLGSQQLYDHHGERCEYWLDAGKGERTQMHSQLPHGDLGWVTGSHRQTESWLVVSTENALKKVIFSQLTSNIQNGPIMQLPVLPANSPVILKMGQDHWTYVELHVAHHFEISNNPH